MKKQCIHKDYCKSEGCNAIDESVNCKCYNCNDYRDGCFNSTNIIHCKWNKLRHIYYVSGVSLHIARKILESGNWDDIRPKKTWE